MSDKWFCVPYARPFRIYRTLSIHNQSLTASSSSLLIFGPFRDKYMQTLRYSYPLGLPLFTLFIKIVMPSLIPA